MRGGKVVVRGGEVVVGDGEVVEWGRKEAVGVLTPPNIVLTGKIEFVLNVILIDFAKKFIATQTAEPRYP